MSQVIPSEPRTTAVATLLGAAQLPSALPCLDSLLRCCADPVTLVIHDDGTLTDEERARLVSSLPGASVLDRQTANGSVEASLARHPHLNALRRSNPLYLKLLDVRLLSPATLAYVDSDVLFLRHFRGLFELPEWAQAAFMLDSQHAYALRSWQALRSGVQLAGQINTGLILFRGPLDLDALEWLVTRPGFGNPPVWAEQTAWAFLAARVPTAYVDSAQLTFPGQQTPETVALHFISPLRRQLPDFCTTDPKETGRPVSIRFRPGRRATCLGLALNELRRRARRPPR